MKIARYIFWFAQVVSCAIGGFCLFVYSLERYNQKYNMEMFLLSGVILISTSVASVVMQPGAFSGQFWTSLAELEKEKQKLWDEQQKLERLQQKYLSKINAL